MATAGKILMFPVGNWTSGNNYGFLDIVYFGGSSYIAKTDITNSTVDPNTDTTNWQILARGYLADTLSGIEGIDASGLLGVTGATVSSQTLIDKIADMVADKLVLKTAISNQQVNDTTKVTGSALAYSMGQSIDTLRNDLDPTSIGNAVASTDWQITASNITINNSIGLIYGKTTYTGTGTPAWGSTVGTFPNYHSGYNLPLLLFRTDGNLCLTATVSTDGVIRVYYPDLAKIVNGAEFHFQAIYAV